MLGVRPAEFLQAFVDLVPKPADAQILQFGVHFRRARWRLRAMGNATVIAELIAQGRGGPGPIGAGVPVGLASEGFGGVAARRWLASARPASGELAASRPSVQVVVAGRWPRAARARSRSTPTTAPAIAALRTALSAAGALQPTRRRQPIHACLVGLGRSPVMHSGLLTSGMARSSRCLWVSRGGLRPFGNRGRPGAGPPPWRLGAGVLGSARQHPHTPSQHEPPQVLVPQHGHIAVTSFRVARGREGTRSRAAGRGSPGRAWRPA